MFETSIKHMLSGVDILVAGRYSRADEIRIKWVWETFYWAIRTFIRRLITYSLLRGNYTNYGQLLPQLMLKYFHGYKLTTKVAAFLAFDAEETG